MAVVLALAASGAFGRASGSTTGASTGVTGGGNDSTASDSTASDSTAPDSTAPATTDPGTTQPATTSPAPATTDPASVVEAYINAINQQNYSLAWSLGGDNTGGTLSSFAAGYGTTAGDVLTVESVAGDVVTAQLAATQTDGTVKDYAGTYTVVNGTIVAFDIKQTN